MNKIIIFIFFFYTSTAFTQDLLYIKDISDLNKIRKDNTGKVLLFNFWATWCEPCKEEFPDLIKLNNEYGEKNLKLILVSLDFKEDIESKLLPFLKSNNVDFVTYYLSSSNPDSIMNYFDKKWDGGIPATFIFDREGNYQKFILGKSNYDNFEKEIKKYL